MGTATVGALRAVLGLDTAAFEAGLGQAQKELAKAGKEFQKLGAQISKVGLGMSVGLTLPLVAFGKKSVDAFDESAKAVGAVEEALNSMGAVAGFTSKQLQDMASGLQNVSTFDDEAILGGVTANLLTFGKVTGQVFERAQLAAVNLSARLGQDLQTSTIQLGKALNDPVKGLTSLARVGVAFTAQQKAQIKAMVQAGDVAGAQKLILSELEREYSGQAAALAKTDWGRQQVAMNAFNDAMEDIGKTIRAVMPDVARAIKGVADAFMSLPPAARQGIVMGAAFTAAIGPLVTVFGGLVSVLGATLPMLARLGPAMAGAAGSTGLLATAMRGLSASVLFMGPWAIAIGAVAAALGVLYVAMNNQGTASRETKKAQDALNQSLAAYEQAAMAASIATGKAREEALKDVAAKKLQAQQTLASARAKLAEAQASLAQLAANEKLARQISGDEGGFDVVGISAGLAGKQLTKQMADLRASIAEAEKRMADADAILHAKPPALPAVPVTPAGKAARGSNPTKVADHQRELEDTRARMELERQLTEAEAAGDAARVRALQDQLYLMERIDAWRQAGLSAVGALIKAEQDLTAAQALRTAEARKAWEQHNVEALQGSAQDSVDLLAKAEENRARLAQLRLEHELDIARIEGDPRRIAMLEREMEIARKTAEYRAAGMGGVDAVLQASTDTDEADKAKQTGFWRDALKDGFRAALEGDLKDFFRDWMKDRLSQGMERSLDRLADSFQQLLGRINWGQLLGGGGEGGGFFASITKGLGSLFGGGGGGGGAGSIASTYGQNALATSFASLIGFAGGGSFKVGGAGGVDRNLVAFKATRGERVTVETPGQQANGVRGGGFTVNYNIKTADGPSFGRTQRQILNETKRSLDRGYL